MNKKPASDYAKLMAEGREQLQVEATPRPRVARKTFEIALEYASTPEERIAAIQMAGIAARKAGLIFEAIEDLTIAFELAERVGNCLLTAITLRNLGAAYQTAYNRRYRIEYAEDRERSEPSDDGKVLSEVATTEPRPVWNGAQRSSRI